MGIHGSSRIWVDLGKKIRKLWFGLGRRLRNESHVLTYVLMDNGLDLGHIFRKKLFGFGFGFPIMGRVVFGPEILPRDGL